MTEIAPPAARLPVRPLLFWIGGALVFLLLLWLLRGILLPFVAGLIVAYLLDPVADRLERWGLGRMMATIVITVAFFLMLFGLAALLVPLLQQQVVDLVYRIPHIMDVVRERLVPLVVELSERFAPGQAADLREALGEQSAALVKWLGGVLTGLWSGGLAFFNLLSLLFITPLVTFYMLRDWDRIVAKVDGWLPRPHAPTIRAQFAEIDRTLSGFLRGQAMVCAFLAAFYAIGLMIIGLDFGLVVGLIAGAISFIPFLGSLFGFVTSVGLALAQFPDPWWIALVAGVFLLGQVIEGNILTPKLVGDRVGLHPLWVIFALLAAGALLGFVGVLLAVPLAAVIGVLVRFALSRYLSSPLYRGELSEP